MRLQVRVRRLSSGIIVLILLSFPLLLVTEFYHTININCVKVNSLSNKINDDYTLYYNSLSSSIQMDIQWSDIENNSYEQSFNNIILDSNGSSIVMGSEGDDISIQKYNFLGELKWNATWGGFEMDKAEAIVIDNLSNIYITGYTESFGANTQDIIVVKYNIRI